MLKGFNLLSSLCRSLSQRKRVLIVSVCIVISAFIILVAISRKNTATDGVWALDYEAFWALNQAPYTLDWHGWYGFWNQVMSDRYQDLSGEPLSFNTVHDVVLEFIDNRFIVTRTVETQFFYVRYYYDFHEGLIIPAMAGWRVFDDWFLSGVMSFTDAEGNRIPHADAAISYANDNWQHIGYNHGVTGYQGKSNRVYRAEVSGFFSISYDGSSIELVLSDGSVAQEQFHVSRNRLNIGVHQFVRIA